MTEHATGLVVGSLSWLNLQLMQRSLCETGVVVLAPRMAEEVGEVVLVSKVVGSAVEVRLMEEVEAAREVPMVSLLLLLRHGRLLGLRYCLMRLLPAAEVGEEPEELVIVIELEVLSGLLLVVVEEEEVLAVVKELKKPVAVVGVQMGQVSRTAFDCLVVEEASCQWEVVVLCWKLKRRVLVFRYLA